MSNIDPDLSTQERILNASEALFAEYGFDGVSLRKITQMAGVELALANYHFGPKKDLFLAVIRRRAAELNLERSAALGSLDENASLEAMIDAFTRPFMEKSAHGGAGWKNYARLIAQTANSPRWSKEIMASQFDAVANEFLQRARHVLPHSDERNIYWAFHFLLGAMTITFAETGRIDNLSNGLCQSSELETIHANMVPFLAAGFRAICVANDHDST